MRLFILVLLYLIPHFSSGNSIHQERSALWVVRYALTTKSSIDKVIATAIELQISDIFVQVRALGETYYSSNLESQSSRVAYNFDPLKYFIDRSRNTGIRIHAWVNMFYSWSGVQFPKNANHIINKRSDYILRNDRFPDYKSLRARGYEGYFLDPKVPVIQKDLLNILKELARGYDISGIHLDYYRYPGLAYSFTPASRTIYMLDEIYDPWSIYRSANKYSYERGYQVFITADKQYRNSLVETLSNYLKYISASIKKINSKIEISVAVKPDPVQAKHRFFQDWSNWIQDKICDFVVIMNYRTDWNEFDQILKQIQNKKIENKVMVGISTYNQSMNAVLRRLTSSRIYGFAGFSLFSYNYLNDNKSYLRELKLKLSTGELDGS
jgi:uncharacterized lipoprotein YddW (UPF0748 family)